MIDRTQEDINQDVRIAKLEQHVRELGETINTLNIAKDHASVTLRVHGAKLEHLDPLVDLVEYVEHIKAFFEEHMKVFGRK